MMLPFASYESCVVWPRAFSTTPGWPRSVYRMVVALPSPSVKVTPPGEV